MLEVKEEKGLKYFFGKHFGSEYTAVFFLLFGVICWINELPEFVVIVFAAAFVLTLVFCKDVKNIFAYLFYVPYFIVDAVKTDNIWSVYVPCIAAGAVSIISFLVCKIVVEDKAVKKGGLFYPCIAFFIAMLTGGLIGRFSVLAFSAIMIMAVEILFLYVISINFTENLSEFLSKIFIVGGILIFIELVCWDYRVDSVWIFENSEFNMFFSAESFNTAAILITLGIAGCFFLGAGRKHDYLYAIISIFLVFCVAYTRCRMMTFIAMIAVAVQYVFFIIFSKKKTNFLWLTAAFIIAATALIIAFSSEVWEIFYQFVSKNGKGPNGRSLLWPWCIEKFKEYPYFGYGYYTAEQVPTVRRSIISLVLAHNTFLQWLTATGVIGTSIAAYFYLGKYSVLFKKFNKDKIFHAVSVIAIAASGITDQAAAMDIFIIILPIIIIAAAETSGKKGFVSTSF